MALFRFSTSEPLRPERHVYSTRDILTNQTYVLKMTGSLQEPRLHESVAAHPNVVSIFAWGYEGDDAYLILEECHCDLHSLLMERSSDPDNYVNADQFTKQIFTQILDGVEYCHRKGVYHRDLKPENILVTDRNQIRLADFGLATDLERCKEVACGTREYMAPECWTSKPYSPAPSDVWSLGIILINLVCRRNPWGQACIENNRYAQYLKTGVLSLSLEEGFSEQFVHILEWTFQENPSKRATIPQLRDMIIDCEAFRSAGCSALTVFSDAPGLTCPTKDQDTIPCTQYSRDTMAYIRMTQWRQFSVPMIMTCPQGAECKMCPCGVICCTTCDQPCVPGAWCQSMVVANQL